SGYMFESALEAGFVAAGVNAMLIGPLPTPGIAYMTRRFECDFGVVISASHNPYDDNGIKFFDATGAKLSDDLEDRIEQELAQPPVTRTSRSLGRATRVDKSRTHYQDFCASTLPPGTDLTGLKIVIDCANGAAYKVAPTALYELGAEVIEIGVTPNGFNINEECGSTNPGGLVKAVREYRADIGLALDGDADRLVICDEKGQLVDGDQIMALIAKSWAAQGKLAGGGVVATVMSNLGLERFLADRGLSLERTPVGDRSVMVRMREGCFNLGGEPSGHIILSDYSTTGDGLIAALQVLAELVRSTQPMSALARQFEPVPQKMENVRFSGGRPLETDTVKSAIARAQDKLNGSGRVLVRASGTEPLIRIMAEGDDEKLISQLVREIAGAVKTAAAAAA
ncbi:MAG TPA: phosphoglucosamine mutase, partial [Caulobacteraceae bacterium]